LPHTGLDEEFDAGSLEELDNSFEEESSNESLEDEFADEVPDEIVADEEEDDAGDDEVTTEGKPEIKSKKKVGKGMSPMIKLAGIATLSVALIGGAVFMFMPEINKMMGNPHPHQVARQSAPAQMHQTTTEAATLSNPKPDVSQTPVNISEPASKGTLSLASGIGEDSNTSIPGKVPGTSLTPKKDSLASNSGDIPTKTSSSEAKIIAGMNAMIDRLNNLNVQVSKLSYDSSNANSAQSNDNDSIVLKKLIRKVDTLNKRIRTANRNITKLRRSGNQIRRTSAYHPSRTLRPAVYPVHKVRHIKYIVMAAVPGTAWVYHAKDVHGKYKPTGDVFKLSDGDTIKGYGKVTRITSDGKIMCEHGSLPTKVLE